MSLLAQDLHLVQSQNESYRSKAWESLQMRLHSNPEHFLVDLSSELINSKNSAYVRQLAGIQLKNAVQNSLNDESLIKIWDTLTEESKSLIRERSLSCLASEVSEVRLVASQVVSAFASQDLPKGAFPELLSVLITNASNTNKIYKLSAIRTIGYICEYLQCTSLSQSDSILTVLADCLQPEETDPEIILSSLSALRNSLKFFSSNFENDGERSVLLGLLLTCCNSSIEQIKISSLLILSDVASLFYPFLQDNLVDLGRTTYALIKSDNGQTSLCAVEFWNQIADVEAELVQRRRPVQGYIKTAAATLIPLLLEKIHLFFNDDDEWDFQKAASTTLESVSMVLGNEILEYLGEYIAKSIRSEDLRLKHAAVMVIGSILEGLEDAVLMAKITFQDLLMMTHEKSLQKSVLWVFGKFCEFHLRALIDLNLFSATLGLFIDFLTNSTELAYFACCGIQFVLQSSESYKHLDLENLSFLVNNLMKAANRSDSMIASCNIFVTSLSSIFYIIENSSTERLAVVNSHREALFQMLKDRQDPVAQESICSVFHSLFGKAPSRSIEDSFAERFIDLVLHLFEAKSDVLEEGLIALSSLALCIRSGFEVHLKRVAPFIVWSLGQPSNSHNKAALIVLGDLSRELGNKIDLLVKDSLPLIINYLSNSAVLFEIKIRAVEVLGDLAANNFLQVSVVLNEVLRLIHGAAQLSLDLDLNQTFDVPELLLELREAVISFFVGAVQGSSSSNRKDLIVEDVGLMVEDTLNILNPVLIPSKNIHYAALGLFGDLFDKFNDHPALFKPGIQVFIQMIQSQNDPELREICVYASRKMQITEID